MNSKKRRRSFTLLEILISIFILTLISSLLGVQGYGLLKRHRFEKNARELYQSFRHLQMLALTHGCDLELCFQKEEDGYLLTCKTDAAFKDPPLSLKKLPEVHQVSVDGQKKHVLAFTFFSSGRIEPESLLGIHHHSEKKEENSLWIDLREPLLIKFSSEKNKANTSSQISEVKDVIYRLKRS